MALGFFKSDPQTALMDPDVIAAKRKLLLAADAERRKIKPIQHWTQGAAMLANALADKWDEDKLNAATAKGNSIGNNIIAEMLKSQFGTPAAASSPVAASVPGGAVTGTPGATSSPVVAGKTDLEEKFGPMFGNAAFKEAAAKVLAPKLAGGAAGRPDSISGMNPDLAVGLARAATDAPGNVAINSGYRSPQLQAKLFDAAVMKYGSPQAARKWVAPAGRSQHNVGNAADLGMDPQTKAFMHQNAGRYGLEFPMGHEPWHIQAIRGQASNAPQAIAQATAANPAAAPAAAPVAAPAATGGVNPALAKIISNPVAMKWVKQNPVALAMLMQQVKSNSPAAKLALQNTILGIKEKEMRLAGGTADQREKLRLEVERLKNPPQPDAVRTLQALSKDKTLLDTDLARKRASAPKNEGAPPQGYRYIRDANGNVERLEVIPGSKQATAAILQEKQKKREALNAISVINDIEKTAKEAWLSVSGPAGVALSKIPGTAAADVKNNIDTLKATISFSALQAMRQASATGGALGGIAVRELELLGSTIRSLEQSQSPAQFSRNLAIVKKSFADLSEETKTFLMNGQKESSGGARKPAAAPAESVPTATGPNGQKLYLRNGKWVDK